MGHAFKVAARHFDHHLLVQAVCNALDHVFCSINLIRGDVCILEDLIGTLAPSPFDNIPHPLNWIEGAALWREELELELLVLHFCNIRILMDLQIVHHYDGAMSTALVSQPHHKRKECIHRVAARKCCGVYETSDGAQSSYHSN